MAGLSPAYDSVVLLIIEKTNITPLQRVYSLLMSHENRLLRHASINVDGSILSLNLAFHGQSRNNFSSSMTDQSRRGRQ